MLQISLYPTVALFKRNSNKIPAYYLDVREDEDLEALVTKLNLNLLEQDILIGLFMNKIEFNRR